MTSHISRKGPSTMLDSRKRSTVTRICGVAAVLLSLLPEADGLDRNRTSAPIDLRSAHIVVPDNLSGPEKKSIDLLVDEIAARTRLRLPVVHVWPTDVRVPI